MSANNLNDLYKTRIQSGSLKDDPHQYAAIRALQCLADDLANEKPKRLFSKKKPIRGVYIHGPVGRGKSMLMDMFFNSIPDTIAKRRVHFHAFMIEVHDYLHAARQKGEGDSALMRLATQFGKSLRVLCFDEFHVVDVADAMILSRLFTALLEHGLAVVATSNSPPEKLYEGGLQRDRFLPFIDLVKKDFDIVGLDGPIDYRMRILEDTGVYHWPLGHHTQEWADNMFQELSGGTPENAEQLTVKGRILDVAHVARNVARFTFAQLCERPLGAEDYLAISRAYHTIFLEGIPKLRYDRRNEAKRLMILIDALYDSGTRLIVTADAPPDKLYFGKDHEFEFQRTVSRLLEMQSHEWLEKTRQRNA